MRAGPHHVKRRKTRNFETEVTIMSAMPEAKSIKDGLIYFGWLCVLTVIIAVVVAVTL